MRSTKRSSGLSTERDPGERAHEDDGLHRPTGHWSDIYTREAAVFGEEPIEFGRLALERFRLEGARDVLELGCGQGRDTVLFGQEGFAVTALDYSTRAVEEVTQGVQARGLNTITAQVFDLRKRLPFPDRSFDACFSHMLFCIELNEEENAFVMNEVRRVLRPKEYFARNGLLILTRQANE